MHGSAAATELAIDRASLSAVARLPGLPSSHIGVDHVLGLDTRVGWEDVLGLPELSPHLPLGSPQDRMEAGR